MLPIIGQLGRIFMGNMLTGLLGHGPTRVIMGSYDRTKRAIKSRDNHIEVSKPKLGSVTQDVTKIWSGPTKILSGGIFQRRAQDYREEIDRALNLRVSKLWSGLGKVTSDQLQTQSKNITRTGIASVDNNFAVVQKQIGIISNAFIKYDQKQLDIEKVMNDRLSAVTQITIKHQERNVVIMDSQLKGVRSTLAAFTSQLETHDRQIDRLSGEISTLKNNIRVKKSDEEEERSSPLPPQLREKEGGGFGDFVWNAMMGVGGVAVLGGFIWTQVKDKVAEAITEKYDEVKKSVTDTIESVQKGITDTYNSVTKSVEDTYQTVKEEIYKRLPSMPELRLPQNVIENRAEADSIVKKLKEIDDNPSLSSDEKFKRKMEIWRAQRLKRGKRAGFGSSGQEETIVQDSKFENKELKTFDIITSDDIKLYSHKDILLTALRTMTITTDKFELDANRILFNGVDITTGDLNNVSKPSALEDGRRSSVRDTDIDAMYGPGEPSTQPVSPSKPGTFEVEGMTFNTPGSASPTSVSKDAITGDLSKATKAQRMQAVYNAFRKLGYTDAGARVMAAEVQRETGYKDQMFGYERDPYNGQTNGGMLNMAHDRLESMVKHLRSKGLVNPDGTFVKSTATLDAMAEWHDQEMGTGGGIGVNSDKGKRIASLRDKLRDPQAKPSELHRTLGKDYIRWRIDDPRYRDSGYRNLHAAHEEMATSIDPSQVTGGHMSQLRLPPGPAIPGSMRGVIQSQSRTAAIRRKPISNRLNDVLGYAAAQAGVEIEVISGGQAGIGQGGLRTGSTRHDHGNAADVDLYVTENGVRRKLYFTNPQDRPYFEKVTQAAASVGATGIGAGTGYMGSGRMHIGFGKPATWGYGDNHWLQPNWAKGMNQFNENGPARLESWKKEELAKKEEEKAVPEKPAIPKPEIVVNPARTGAAGIPGAVGTPSGPAPERIEKTPSSPDLEPKPVVNEGKERERRSSNEERQAGHGGHEVADASTDPGLTYPSHDAGDSAPPAPGDNGSGCYKHCLI